MVSKRDFACVVKKPFESAFSITNIKNGFRKCGIFPFNRDAISKFILLVILHQVDHRLLPHLRVILPQIVPVHQSHLYPQLQAEHHKPQKLLQMRAALRILLSAPENSPENVPENTPVNAPENAPVNAPENLPENTLVNAPENACVAPVTSCVTSPLVQAGLIPSHLADILVTPRDDPGNEKPKRRFIKARRMKNSQKF